MKILLIFISPKRLYMNMPLDRRNFIKNTGMAGMAVGFSLSNIRAFAASQTNKVRVGMIGVGMRGQNHLEMMLQRDDVDVIAMADPDPKMMATALNIVSKSGKKTPVSFGNGPYNYKDLLKRDDIDAVIIATPWEWHVPQAIDAMNAGKIPGVEVCGAIKLQDCWDMVNTSEKTKIPVMMLENVCYRRDVLAVYNMVRKGMFGELLHLQGGYEHDLRYYPLRFRC